MDCPTCGATAMLGSAQCPRCGSSLLGAGSTPPPSMLGPQAGRTNLGDLSSTLPAGPPDPPHTHPPGTGGLAAPPSAYGFPPPPPPPTPPSYRVGRTIQVGPQPLKQRRSGCGCLFSLLLLVGLGAGGVALYNAAEDFDGFGDFFENLTPGIDVTDAGPLPLGEEIDGDLGEGEADDYTLTGTGDVLTFVVRSPDDTVLELYEGDSDTPVAEDDDSGPGSRNPILRAELDEGREYRLRVRPFSDSGSADTYQLLAVATADARSAEAGYDVVELGPVERGTTELGAVLRGEEAHYELTGGGPVTIDARAVGEGDPRLTVFGADGRQLAFDDDSGDEGFDARVTLELPPDETVTVVVHAFGSTLVYELSVG